MSFLPACPQDMAALGWKPGDLDAIIVSGDAYVDHSSFGVAIIGRVLAAEGYKIGIIARPDPDDVGAFRILGRPRLAWLVTAGAVDSMVSSYTANRKIRSEDDYAPGGHRELCMRADSSIGPGIKARRNARPDRATIVYAGMCRQAYKGIPVIAGGIEASLRRLSHYDYWSDTVRKSILLDAKADSIVYGMGETAIVTIMARLSGQAQKDDEGAGADKATRLRGIRGTVWAGSRKSISIQTDDCVLPSFEEIAPATLEGKTLFARSFAAQYRNTDPFSARRIIEPAGDRLVVQEAPAFPLEREAMDYVYGLPYMRAAHPMYAAYGGVPALAEVKFSLLSSRGCFGACAFCSLQFHQGRKVSSRSRASIVAEARTLTKMRDFKGYIHDVGGPTANFRIAACAKMQSSGACVDKRCLAPEPCVNLRADQSDYVSLLRELRSIPSVKKVFIRSGVRFDYAMLDPSDTFLRELVRYHISGQLKVAPEHTSDNVLRLMGKPPRRAFDAFMKKYESLNKEAGLQQFVVPYFISAHPGSGLAEAVELAEYLRDSGLRPDQAQDFYPTPGTLATAMWRCGIHPLDNMPVYVARGDTERGMQRALMQFWKPENRATVKEALKAAGRTDLIGSGPKCLVR